MTRWRSLAVALVAMLAAGLLSAPPAAAVIGDPPLITYNMQGATSGADSKWTTTIQNYANRAEIVALQEAGSGPPGTAAAPIQGAALANSGPAVAANLRESALPPVVAANGVRHSLWQTGTGTFDVYFLQTDAQSGRYQGGRVNLAMVTQRAADDVAAIPNPNWAPNPPNGNASPENNRATLGLRFGDTWYFTLHAQSGGGGDVQGLLGNISAFVTGRGLNEHWIALGDYNRAPGTIAGIVPANSVVYAGTQPTQQSGGVLDYAVSSHGGAVQVNRLAGASSDHYAVAIGALRAAAEPTPLFGNYTAIENMQAGGLVDAREGGTVAGTPIISSRRNGGANQSWTVETYNDNSVRIKGKQSGRCLLPQLSVSTATWNVNLADCTNDIWERFTLEYLGNDEYQVHGAFETSLCLNVSGGQTDPSTVKNLILWDCQNTPNERWIFTAAEASLGSVANPDPLRELYPGPAVLENMKAGGVANAKDGRTANGTQIVSFHRTGAANQGWNLQWTDDTTVTFKGAASGRCIDTSDNEINVDPGQRLELADCDNHDSQQWQAQQLINGQAVLHNREYPELCMDIEGAPDNPNNGALIVSNCSTVSPNQQWLFTSYDPTGAPPPDQDWAKDELTVIPDPGPPAQRTAYFPSWSVYANEFYVKNLDTEGIAGRLTTLTYAFENIDPDNLTCFAANQAGSSDESDTTGNDGASDAWADYQMGYTSDNSVDGTADSWDQPLKGNFNQLKKLKAKYPNLKVTVSLGGWTYAKYFSDVAATEASRQKFVSSCIDMYIKGDLPQLGDDPAGGTGVAAGIFDGFDIDWEFPGSENGHAGNHYGAQDTENFTLLLAEFRRQLDALGGPHRLLTAALPSGSSDIDKIDVPQLANSLDMADVMTYDMHGAWETEGPTNGQAPLYDSPASPAAGSGLTANDAVDHYLIRGLPASKLSLGVPFYGRGWTGVPAGDTNGLYQPVTGPTEAFPYSQQEGVAMYKELKAAGKLTDLHYDTQTQSSWVYDGTNFWSIESPYTLTAKRQYIKDRHLGGIMMYSLEADDAQATLVGAATGLLPAP